MYPYSSARQIIVRCYRLQHVLCFIFFYKSYLIDHILLLKYILVKSLVSGVLKEDKWHCYVVVLYYHELLFLNVLKKYFNFLSLIIINNVKKNVF